MTSVPTSTNPAAAGVRPLSMPARIVLLLVALAAVPIAAPSGYGLLWLGSYASVGALLAIRRPGNPIGWVLLGIGWSQALLSGSMDVTPAQFTDGSLSAPERVGAWLFNACGLVAFTLYAGLMAVFPSGRLPVGRLGALLRVGIAIDLVAAGLTAFAPLINVNMPGYPDGAMVPNPYAIAPDAPFWRTLPVESLFVITLIVLVLAALSLVARFRHAVGVERQQLRWVASAVVAMVVAMLGGLAVTTVIPSGIGFIPAILAFAALPLSIGVAVLRYRLYEIDRILSRTIGWAIVTGILVVVFAAGVIGLQAALAGVTQGETLAVAVSTLGAFALFQPLRRRVQAAVDRRFNRRRIDAQQALGVFGSQLRDEVDLAAISRHLVDAAASTVEPRTVGLWTRTGRADP